MNRHLLSLFVIPALALPAMAAEKPKPLFTSPVVTSKTPGHAVSIDVDLKGSRSLFLVVDETSDGYGCDWGFYGYPFYYGRWSKGRIEIDRAQMEVRDLGMGKCQGECQCLRWKTEREWQAGLLRDRDSRAFDDRVFPA